MTSFDADGIKPTEKSSPLRAPDHWNFESYWQSRKVHLQNGKQASPEKKQQIKDWWLKNEKPKRRCTIALPNHTQIPFGHGYVIMLNEHQYRMNIMNISETVSINLD